MGRESEARLPVEPVQRIEDEGERSVHRLDCVGVEIPIRMAKAQIGVALKQSIKRSDSQLKEFGDPSYVNRVCAGEVPDWLARAWARPETRRELVMALAVASGFFEAETTLKPKKKERA